MPRLARLDAPGVIHHIIIRGIERRKIFRDNHDRENLLERLGKLLLETKTGCYAWAFLPNHAHFLLRRGEVPLATLMRRLLTGYVVSFNRRHKRQGHKSGLRSVLKRHLDHKGEGTLLKIFFIPFTPTSRQGRPKDN